MKKAVQLIGIAAVIGLLYFGFTTYPKLDLISGFSAKSIASGHFIDHRSQQMIEQGDNDIDKVDWATNAIDENDKSVLSKVYGLKARKAIYREGLGATLINDDFDVTKPYNVPKRNASQSHLPYPYGNGNPIDTSFTELDAFQLQKAVEAAFDKEGEKNKRTRAVVVLYKGRLVAEKYGPGFRATSKILGWSMTKSLTATYFGILQKQGKIDIMKPAPIAAWKNDEQIGRAHV